MVWLLIILQVQVPGLIPIPAPRKKDLVDWLKAVPTYYIIVDGSDNSKLLKGCLTRDWGEYGRVDLLETVNSLRVKKIIWVRHDDYTTHKVHRIPMEYNDFPRYRLGSSGPTLSYPKSTFSCNDWPIFVSQCLVEEYFFDEQLKHYEEKVERSKKRHKRKCLDLAYDWIFDEYIDGGGYLGYDGDVMLEDFMRDHPWFDFPRWHPPPKTPKIRWPWEGLP